MLNIKIQISEFDFVKQTWIAYAAGHKCFYYCSLEFIIYKTMLGYYGGYFVCHQQANPNNGYGLGNMFRIYPHFSTILHSQNKMKMYKKINFTYQQNAGASKETPFFCW